MAQVGRKINELNEEDKNSAIVHEIEKYPPCKNKYSKTQQFNCKKKSILQSWATHFGHYDHYRSKR